MGKWKCKECGTEVFEVKIKVRETISKMNENGVAVEVVYKDKVASEYATIYRCDGCGIEDSYLEDIAEWMED